MLRSCIGCSLTSSGDLATSLYPLLVLLRGDKMNEYGITDCVCDNHNVTWCWDCATELVIKIANGKMYRVKLENTPVAVLTALLNKQHDTSVETTVKGKK